MVQSAWFGAHGEGALIGCERSVVTSCDLPRSSMIGRDAAGDVMVAAANPEGQAATQGSAGCRGRQLRQCADICTP